MNPINLKKYAIIAVIVIVLLVVVIFVGVKIKNVISDTIKEQKQIDEANKGIDEEKLTTTTSQYNTIASKLYTAMKGIGTDEEAVYSAFSSLQTYSDLMQVMSNFGVKDSMVLREWIQSELNLKEIDKVNNILAAKSINYTF